MMTGGTPISGNRMKHIHFNPPCVSVLLPKCRPVHGYTMFQDSGTSTKKHQKHIQYIKDIQKASNVSRLLSEKRLQYTDVEQTNDFPA